MTKALQLSAGSTPVQGTFLAALGDAERDALSDLGSRHRFPRGAVLMFQDEPAERVMLVISGRVKVTRVDRDGHELMLSIRDPGDVLGELAFIDGQPRIATVTALEPVEGLVLSGHDFQRHLETTPGVAVRLLQVVASRVREATLKRLQLAAVDTMGRLALRLVELAERYGESSEQGTVFLSPLSQEDLVAWTGASRAGVANALRTFRELAWVETNRRRVLVRDLEALRARGL